MNIIKLLRPHQWIKNGFVLIGVIFAHSLTNPLLLQSALLATLAFCCMSSTVYIYNDMIDHPHDKLHPTKKHRPIASGKIPLRTAGAIAFLLFLFGLGFGLMASHKVAIILLTYFILNIFYTHFFKHIVILDVFIISAGFMLRILAGTIGINIPASPWLLFCGLALTLFLGFAKRRAEIFNAGSSRKVLQDYNQVFLDKMISITASCTVISYALYTMSPDTIRIHHTANLIYTVPFVIYGIFRYLFLLHKKMGGEDTAKDLIKDKQLLLAILGWILATLYLLL